MRKDWDTVVGPFPLDWADGLSTPNEPFLYVSTSLPRYSGPKWMAFAASEQGTFSKRERWPAREYPRDVYRHDDSGTKFAYEPGKTEFSDLTPNKPLYIVIALADTKLDAGALARTLLRSKEQSLNTLIADLTESETKLGIESDSASLDKAVKWAHATVDSLSMNVAGRGIYAGFHWFTQYWGRDSFISLQGAVLTSREFDLARQFIATMADAQDINFNSKTYGRVPNILQHPDAGANNYETADGSNLSLPTDVKKLTRKI